jgi:hypothetical protein
MRQRIHLAALVVMVGAAAYIGYSIGTADARPRPQSYREAVERVLNEQRIDYRDVEVVDGCAPSYQFCRTYAGTVRVMAAITMSGQIDCRERWITCSLTIQQAGIMAIRLDNTIDPLTARWEALYGWLMLRFHEFYRSIP